MSGVIPFGKYKGQPVEVVAQDKQYVDWLTAQPWFRERFANIYTLIVNNFHEPSETPEHNRLQALFLERDFCLRFAREAAEIKLPDRRLAYGSRFEVGWDVVLSVWDAENEHGSLNAIELYVEIKPVVADDYPAVLRQIRTQVKTESISNGGYAVHPILFLERYTGKGATEAQFINIFESVGVKIVFLDECS
jgi:hypothetical protein